MKKKMLLTLISILVVFSVFGEDYPYEYNVNNFSDDTETPSLTVTLSTSKNILGFGFSSSDPKSTSGITNISEMPLTITPTLNAEKGNIQLTGSGSFYIWWQIKKPIESGEGYSF